MERPVEEIASLAANAGRGPGCGGLGQESGDTLHPLGFASHVKKCNVLKRSKTYSICGVSINRESIQKHETACRARREEVNPVAPVCGRITGKRPPDRDYLCRREWCWRRRDRQEEM